MLFIIIIIILFSYFYFSCGLTFLSLFEFCSYLAGHPPSLAGHTPTLIPIHASLSSCQALNSKFKSILITIKLAVRQPKTWPGAPPLRYHLLPLHFFSGVRVRPYAVPSVLALYFSSLVTLQSINLFSPSSLSLHC